MIAPRSKRSPGRKAVRSTNLSGILQARLDSKGPSGPGKADVDGAGPSESDLHRAIERGNLFVAEKVLRELGRPTLVELLELTILIAFKNPRRYPRVAGRWLLRYLKAHGEATIDDAAFAVACPEAVGGPNNLHAVTALRDMAERASCERCPAA